MKIYKAIILALVFAVVCSSACMGEETRGFLDNPPVYLTNEYDFPLTGLGTVIPNPGEAIPAIETSVFSSNHAKLDGETVQPNLGTRFESVWIGGLYGLKNNWGAGLTIPVQHTAIRGQIGGEPATSTNTDLGDLTLIGKKQLWSRGQTENLVASVGLKLPTGKDDSTFDQSNAVTNGYYVNDPQRMPLSWQAGTGTVDGYLALAYSKLHTRFSYQALVAARLNSSGDEDVKIGNTVIGSVAGSYGLAKMAAVSLGLILRTQGNDSYPNAPEVGQPALAGTTQHGTTVYLIPAIQIRLANLVSLGFAWKYPIVQPDDGLVPDVLSGFIIYPGF